ncbi:MAG: D-alanyl-D-alanine carboxypeptidase family protein [Gammaproteobacteria bacterium]
MPIEASRAEIPDPPQLPVTAYILVDFDSGAVLAEHAADARVEPASLTKIMTVYSVADALKRGLIKRDDQTVISEYAWKQEGSRMFIEVDKAVAVDELLHGDIVQSGNDASVALAEHVSGSEAVFATVMNGHAKRLGMTGSKFANSSGLPNPETYSTARDLSTLSRALIKEFPAIYTLFSLPEYTYNGITQQNRNGLLRRDPSVDGVKTGHTEGAGYCLVASAVRSEFRLISVVTGADSDASRTRASQTLLNYGFRYYEKLRLFAAGAKVTTARVWKGGSAAVDVGVAEAVFATVPRGTPNAIKVIAEIRKPLVAPLSAGQAVGEVIVSVGGLEVSRTPLLTQSAVPAGAWHRRLVDTVKLYVE